MALKTLFTGAQPKAGTGHKMQTLSVVFLTLHCCEYLERQIYERLLNSEPSIAKLIWNKSDSSKLSAYGEPSIVKFFKNEREHLSKLTLYHIKKRATRRSRRAREPSRIHCIYAIPCPNGPL